MKKMPMGDWELALEGESQPWVDGRSSWVRFCLGGVRGGGVRGGGGFRGGVWGLGFGVWGLGFGVWGLGF